MIAMIPTESPSDEPPSPKVTPSPYDYHEPKIIYRNPLEGHASADASCKETSKRVDVSTIQADQNCAAPETNPIKIESQDGATVSFSVFQVWKGCGNDDSEDTLDWLAADFDNEEGKLMCMGKKSLRCGSSSSFKSGCIDGVAIIDLFVSDDDVFEPNEIIMVPTSCSSPTEGRNTCYYRYVLQCQPSLCKRKYKSDRHPDTIDIAKKNFLRYFP